MINQIATFLFSKNQSLNKMNKHGEGYWYGSTFFGIRVGKLYDKDIPEINTRRIVKATCSQCGKEHIIFDSQYHGYDALAEYETRPVPEFNPQYSYSKGETEALIEVRSDLPYDEFCEDFGDDVEKYSNAFDDIEIYTLTDGKKRRFFSQETA